MGVIIFLDLLSKPLITMKNSINNSFFVKKLLNKINLLRNIKNRKIYVFLIFLCFYLKLTAISADNFEDYLLHWFVLTCNG